MALAGVMDEVGQDTAVSALVAISSRTLAYGSRGRYTEDKAREVSEKLTHLLGHGTAGGRIPT